MAAPAWTFEDGPPETASEILFMATEVTGEHWHRHSAGALMRVNRVLHRLVFELLIDDAPRLVLRMWERQQEEH